MLWAENSFSFLLGIQVPKSLQFKRVEILSPNSLQTNRITTTSAEICSFLLFQPVYRLSHNYHLFLEYSRTIQVLDLGHSLMIW